MKKLVSLTVAVLASGIVAGCKVGPNYHRPVVQPPTAYRDLSESPQVQAQAASYADLPWWQVFQDPQLQELIRIALKQNYDLQLATERINAGRAQVAITRSHLFPQAQGNGDFSGGKNHKFPKKIKFFALTALPPFPVVLFCQPAPPAEKSPPQLHIADAATASLILT